MSTFYTEGHGPDAQTAFNEIAATFNKTSFIEFTVPAGMNPRVFMREAEGNEAIQAVDGPCGCINLGSGTWAFFGQTSLDL